MDSSNAINELSEVSDSRIKAKGWLLISEIDVDEVLRFSDHTTKITSILNTHFTLPDLLNPRLFDLQQ